MTIGEKITHLRIVSGISQDELAKQLGVSRQSLSKWENDETQPQLDNIKQLCELFKISADELIDDKIVIHRGKKLKMSIGEDIKVKKIIYEITKEKITYACNYWFLYCILGIICNHCIF